MKYVISWRERPAASAKEYEAAHERVLQIFNKDYKLPSVCAIAASACVARFGFRRICPPRHESEHHVVRVIAY